MPRRAAVAPVLDPPLDSTSTQIIAEEDSAAELKRAKELYFFDYLRWMGKHYRGILDNSLVYVYRLFPKIENGGEFNYIDKTPANVIDEQWLKESHGGGKYQLWLNSGDEEYSVKRVVSIAGAAKIYPTHVLVDPKTGEPAASAPAAPAGSRFVTDGDVVNIVKTVIEGLKQDPGKSPDQMVSDVMGMMRQVNAASIDILSSSMKNQVNGGSSADAAVLKVLEKLVDKIDAIANRQPEKDPLTTEIQQMALRKMLNPEPAASPVAQIRELLSLKEDGLGLEGILGGGEKPGIWEGIVGRLGDALSEVLKAHAPQLIEAYNNKLRVDQYVAYTRLQSTAIAAQTSMPAGSVAAQPHAPQIPVAHPQPGPQPAAPASTVQAGVTVLPLPVVPGSPLPPEITLPADGGAAPAPPPATRVPAQTQSAPLSASEEQMFTALRQQITGLIATCWEENDDGYDTAITVKRSFKPLLPLLRAHFTSLDQLIQLAKEDPVLANISADPAFPAWAEAFWKEFVTDNPAPPQA